MATVSVVEDSNIVLCVNFSNEKSNFSEFKQNLTEQLQATLLSNGSDLVVKFDNKYYTADITFKFSEISDNSIDEELLRLVSTAQALVIIINSKESSWDKMKEFWDDKMSKECSSDVKLICEYEDSKLVEENPNILWAIKEHFEHVSMGEQLDEEVDDNDFKEKTGVARILEALQAHVWSKLCMKENSPNSAAKKECIFENTTHDEKDSVPVKSEGKIDSLLDGQDVTTVLNEDDPECESFEKLFSNLMEMKKKAEMMEGEDRKLFAEEVATMFLNAIPDSDDDDSV